VESEDVEKSTVIEAQVSWSDRKLRDRMHEKELLAKAKYVVEFTVVLLARNSFLTPIFFFLRKSKLLDDEDVDLPTPMQSAAPWKAPFLLPERPTVVQPQLNSSEVASQQSRILSVSPSRYTSDFDVPLSPDPLSDVEQALDMTSQASAVIIPIPFFAPQLTIPETSTETFVEAVAEEPTFPAVISPPVQDSAASIEVVQSLGLPLFLIGQPVRALQTLAGSPSLLSTLVDANGLYDQTKLLNLIQTLTSSGGLSQPASSQYQPTANSIYGTQYGVSPYGELTHVPSQTIRTVVRKSDEGNLHVSGYGPGVTESDLIATFSPYVHVDEVVLKGTFAFVNTSDPVNAQRAREALTGTHLNGMPLRINNATRKVRDNNNPFAAALPPTNVSSYVPPTQSTYAPQTPAVVQPIAPGMTHPAFGAIHPNIDSVRDDRGNPATKNLFVAGYGPGTTEQMLRDVVGQYSVVTGVVSKGTFAFVNTSDRHGAVVAREYLSGTTFNGGVLRINFAKETGRLGTSFDLTYGPNTGPNSTGSRVRPADMAYYGQS
jgi:RNA recognition motif-containing protein